MRDADIVTEVSIEVERITPDRSIRIADASTPGVLSSERRESSHKPLIGWDWPCISIPFELECHTVVPATSIAGAEEELAKRFEDWPLFTMSNSRCTMAGCVGSGLVKT